MDAPTELDIPDEVLRGALKFAVDIALQRHVARPRQSYPAQLRRLLQKTTLNSRDLATVRAAVDGDDDFRAAVSAKAAEELVDQVGRIYLAGGADWTARLVESLGELPSGATTLASQSAGERRRRAAAEQDLRNERADRQRVEHRLRVERDDARASETALAERLAEREAHVEQLLGQVVDLQSVLGRQQEAAAGGERARLALAEELGAARAEIAGLREQLGEALAARDAALITRSSAHRLAEEDAAGVPWHEGLDVRAQRSPRVPLAIPGGLLGESRQATEFLIRAPEAMVLVDGYNLAKTAWAIDDLERLRVLTIELCESLASRWGTDVAVVFDGATVPGNRALGRRTILVEYSNAGVTADDVIVRWTERTDPRTAVIVVSDDKELGARVRRRGANVVAAASFLDVAMGRK